MVSSGKPTSPELLDMELPQKNSPALDVKRLEEIKAEVHEAKSLERKKEVIFGNVDSLLEVDEAELLEEIRSPEAPSEALVDYLVTGGALHAAEFQLRNGEKFGTITELSKHFEKDSDPSTRTYFRLVQEILTLDTPSSRLFATELLDKIKLYSVELATLARLANRDLKSTAQISPEADLSDPEKQSFYERNKDLVKVGVGFGMAGLGIWAFSRFLANRAEKVENKEKIKEIGGKAQSTLLKVGLATGAGVLLGRMMSNEESDAWLEKNISWFHGSAFHMAWVAVGDLRFKDAWNYLTKGNEHTPEKELQFEGMSQLLSVNKLHLERMSDQNFESFLKQPNKSHTAQERSESKLRQLIINNYEASFRNNIPSGAIPTMTLGSVLQEAMNQGLLRHEIAAPAAQAIDQVKQEETKKMKDRLEAPEANIESIYQDTETLLKDLNQLNEFSTSYVSEVIAAAEFAFNAKFNNTLESDNEYGDLKIAREQILSLEEYAKAADAEAFSQMGQSVRDLQNFLTEHPHPDKWTEAESLKYKTLKGTVLRIRRQVDAALTYGNTEHDRRITEDQKDGFTSLQDLVEGGTLCLQLLSGAILYVDFFMEKSENGETYYLAIPAFQAVMAARANFISPPTGLMHLVFTSLKGATFDSLYVPGKTLFVEGMTRHAFKYSPKELLMMRLQGQISHKDLLRRLEMAEQIGEKMSKNPSLAQRFRKLFGGLDTEAMKKFGVDYRGEHEKWLRYIDHGDDAAIYTQNNPLTNLLAPDEIEHLRRIRKENGLSMPKITQRPASQAGKTIIEVDGQVVTEVADGDFEKTRQAILEQAEKRGTPIRKPSRFTKVWGFLQPVMAVAGIAFVTDLVIRLDQAEGDKDQLQEIVAKECANLITFMVGFGVTYHSLKPLLAGSNISNPKRVALVSLLSFAGGVLSSMGVSEDISYVIKKFLDAYPNGYEITSKTGEVLTGVTGAQTARSATKAIAQPLAKKGMAYLTKGVRSESLDASLRFTTRRLEALTKKKFSEKIAKACGREALYLILKRGGWKGGLAAVAVLVDGPLPIGDLLAAGLAASTIYDVVQLSQLVLEGYRLNEELNRRKNMPLAPNGLKIKGPEALITATKGLTDPNELFTAAQEAQEAKFQVHRTGDAGWEEWHIKNGEIAEMVFYDMSGERIAGIKDEDLDEILTAEEKAA